MFTLVWTETAAEGFRELENRAAASLKARKSKAKGKATKDEGLFKQVVKAIDHLRTNPRHPGLQTHEYISLRHPTDPQGKVFAAYAQNQTPGAYRIFWCYGPGKNQITVLAITPHP